MKMSDSIKVAVRVRPLIEREKNSNITVNWKVQPPNEIFQIDKNDCPVQGSVFKFDRVFSFIESNYDVYNDLCKDIVHSVFNGIHGTIFAYGQTSSGKTFTMSGNELEQGIIAQSINDIFSLIETVPEREYLLRVSYMEIYNEVITDLLAFSPVQLKVKENISGDVYVDGLEEVVISSTDKVLELFKQGQDKRKVGDTSMNAYSSRSHAIFRMIIESRLCEADSQGAVQVSQLNLVDLAGSEKAGQMGTTGQRFQEGVYINQSLFNLGILIKNLSEGNVAVYRNSKLTRILQNSLGGNARTAIICNVTPTAIEQTHSTLMFAKRAKTICNKPVVNEVLSDQAQLKKHKRKIEMLESELQELKSDRAKDLLEKELEEKNKRIEKLEKMTKNLKEGVLVSSLTPKMIAKRTRRETWGGHIKGFGNSDLSAIFPTKQQTVMASPSLSFRSSASNSLVLVNGTASAHDFNINCSRRNKIKKSVTFRTPSLVAQDDSFGVEALNFTMDSEQSKKIEELNFMLEQEIQKSKLRDKEIGTLTTRHKMVMMKVQSLQSDLVNSKDELNFMRQMMMDKDNKIKELERVIATEMMSFSQVEKHCTFSEMDLVDDKVKELELQIINLEAQLAKSRDSRANLDDKVTSLKEDSVYIHGSTQSLSQSASGNYSINDQHDLMNFSKALDSSHKINSSQSNPHKGKTLSLADELALASSHLCQSPCIEETAELNFKTAQPDLVMHIESAKFETNLSETLLHSFTMDFRDIGSDFQNISIGSPQFQVEPVISKDHLIEPNNAENYFQSQEMESEVTLKCKLKEKLQKFCQDFENKIIDESELQGLVKYIESYLSLKMELGMRNQSEIDNLLRTLEDKSLKIDLLQQKVKDLENDLAVKEEIEAQQSGNLYIALKAKNELVHQLQNELQAKSKIEDKNMELEVELKLLDIKGVMLENEIQCNIIEQNKLDEAKEHVCKLVEELSELNAKHNTLQYSFQDAQNSKSSLESELLFLKLKNEELEHFRTELLQREVSDTPIKKLKVELELEKLRLDLEKELSAKTLLESKLTEFEINYKTEMDIITLNLQENTKVMNEIQASKEENEKKYFLLEVKLKNLQSQHELITNDYLSKSEMYNQLEKESNKNIMQLEEQLKDFRLNFDNLQSKFLGVVSCNKELENELLILKENNTKMQDHMCVQNEVQDRFGEIERQDLEKESVEKSLLKDKIKQLESVIASNVELEKKYQTEMDNFRIILDKKTKVINEMQKDLQAKENIDRKNLIIEDDLKSMQSQQKLLAKDYQSKCEKLNQYSEKILKLEDRVDELRSSCVDLQSKLLDALDSRILLQNEHLSVKKLGNSKDQGEISEIKEIKVKFDNLQKRYLELEKELQAQNKLQEQTNYLESHLASKIKIEDESKIAMETFKLELLDKSNIISQQHGELSKNKLMKKYNFKLENEVKSLLFKIELLEKVRSKSEDIISQQHGELSKNKLMKEYNLNLENELKSMRFKIELLEKVRSKSEDIISQQHGELSKNKLMKEYNLNLENQLKSLRFKIELLEKVRSKCEDRNMLELKTDKNVLGTEKELKELLCNYENLQRQLWDVVNSKNQLEDELLIAKEKCKEIENLKALKLQNDHAIEEYEFLITNQKQEIGNLTMELMQRQLNLDYLTQDIVDKKSSHELQVNILENFITELEQQIKEFSIANKNLVKQLSCLQTQTSEMSKDISLTVQTEVNCKLGATLQNVETEIQNRNLKEAEILRLESEISELKATLEEEQLKFQEFFEESTEIQLSDSEKLLKQNEDLEKLMMKIKDLEEENDKLSKSVAPLQDTSTIDDQLKKNVSLLSNKLLTEKSKKMEAEDRNRKLNQRCERLENENKHLSEKLEYFKQQLRKAQNSLNETTFLPNKNPLKDSQPDVSPNVVNATGNSVPSSCLGNIGSLQVFEAQRQMYQLQKTCGELQDQNEVLRNKYKDLKKRFYNVSKGKENKPQSVSLPNEPESVTHPNRPESVSLPDESRNSDSVSKYNKITLMPSIKFISPEEKISFQCHQASPKTPTSKFNVAEEDFTLDLNNLKEKKDEENCKVQ